MSSRHESSSSMSRTSTLLQGIGVSLLLLLQYSKVQAAAGDVTCRDLSSSCSLRCDYGRQKDAAGCDTCSCQAVECQELTCRRGRVCKVFKSGPETWYGIPVCIDPLLPTRCQPPMQRGDCSGQSAKWFFDSELSECVQFAYSGCGGNSNRFDTRTACEASCKKEGNKKGCPNLQCQLSCRHGYLQDSFGCDVCECAGVDPGSKVGVGCKDAGEFDCDLQCEYGYRLDTNGCSSCACAFNPECPELQQCNLDCPNGRRMDSFGCELCQCQLQTCPELHCLYDCPYDRTVDSRGCPTCYCKDPCEFAKNTGCPLATICIPRNVSGMFIPQCIIETTNDNPACAQVQCDLRCEFDLKTDRRGCEMCACRPSRTRCEPLECDTCLFGHEWDEQGCKRCKCLIDPCTRKACEGEEACVADKQCTDCTSYAVCVKAAKVQSARISLEYEADHGISNHEVLLSEFTRHICDVMRLDSKHLSNVKLERTANRITVRFFVKEDGFDVVQLYKDFRTRLLSTAPTDHQVTVQEATYTPRTETLSVSYFRAKEGEARPGWDGLVGLVVGVVIVIAVIVVVVVIVVKVRKAKKKKVPTATLR